MSSANNTKKILHRIFFNFDNGLDPFLPYLESWKKQLPDFTIMEWDKSNLPLDLNDYTRTLAEEKNHAFLSDYFRCWLLKQYGGAYLDADIEILDGDIFRKVYEDTQTSPDYDLFIGVESDKTGGLTPHSMGIKCGTNHPLLDFLMSLYENAFSGPLHHYLKRLPMPDLVSLYFMEKEKKGYAVPSKKGLFFSIKEPLITDKISIYPQEYFSPLTERNNQKVIMVFTAHTCLCHHFAATWKQNSKGEKLAKTLENALIEGNYMISPDCISAILKKIPSIKNKKFKKPHWKLQEKQIVKLEKFLNFFIPYKSTLFRLLKGK
ncbi:MAG TPA: glycosyltransferase [Treponemataceae bacterium]|nr:glycosyltransferase [Treponemataceae bacterium]